MFLDENVSGNYENTPIQYTEIINVVKKENFQ